MSVMSQNFTSCVEVLSQDSLQNPTSKGTNGKPQSPLDTVNLRGRRDEKNLGETEEYLSQTAQKIEYRTTCDI
jgi:hypothetical protein